MKYLKKIMKNFLARMYNFEFKNALIFIVAVLIIYLVSGCLLESVHESQARTYPLVIENK